MYSTTSPANVPAFSLSGQCPSCGQALTVRHTHQGRQPFIGCSAYPACRFTCPYDDALQQLGHQLAHVQRGWMTAHQQAQALSQQLQFARSQGPQSTGISRSTLDGELLALVALAHPDRWRDHPVATELSKALLALRQRVKEGRV